MMQRNNKKSLFYLELTKYDGKIKIRAHEKSYKNEKTIKNYEFKDIDDNEIRKMCVSVINIWNCIDSDGLMNTQALSELQTIGELFYDNLLTGRIKEKLAATEAASLIVSIDDQLVHIPWELLYDGNSFLCHRFNMGRVVSTSQNIPEPVFRNIEKPVKMLIIADPRGDLKASYTEGIRLRDELDNNLALIRVDLQSSIVNTNFIKGALRDYDILHYAGHADYNLKNPSNSGFLMENGKLTALDIINMIGARPLPSLVFSNACKSGHTDMWKVGKDYEKEIYGLANAFLLAGVQHYIGTFWNIQDESGLYFALDFYRKLMSGAMIGEAVRDARLRAKERYGEANVVWASYMLYGDPSVRYIGLSGPEDKTEDSSGEVYRHQKKEMAVRGAANDTESVLIAPLKNRKWIFIGVASFLFIILISFFIQKNYKGNSLLQSQKVLDPRMEDKRSERIDELVTSLVREYKEQQSTGKTAGEKVPKSGAPTLVFIGIKAYGIFEIDKHYIFSKVTDILQNSKRVKVVERDMLDKLLEELRLSSSQLADQETALKIGRLLSANLIISGNILRDGRNWQINLRIIETETTSIKGVLIAHLETKEKDDIAQRISNEILKKIRIDFPLQGKILSITNDTAVLNIGYKDGVKKGLRMKVLSGTDKAKIGELEIEAVEEDSSLAKIVKQDSEFYEGLETEELL